MDSNITSPKKTDVFDELQDLLENFIDNNSNEQLDQQMVNTSMIEPIPMTHTIYSSTPSIQIYTDNLLDNSQDFDLINQLSAVDKDENPPVDLSPELLFDTNTNFSPATSNILLVPPSSHSRKQSVTSLNGQFLGMSLTDATSNGILATSPVLPPMQLPDSTIYSPEPVKVPVSPTFVLPSQNTSPSVLIVPFSLIREIPSPLHSPLPDLSPSFPDFDAFPLPTERWLTQVVESQVKQLSPDEIDRILMKTNVEVSQEMMAQQKHQQEQFQLQQQLHKLQQEQEQQEQRLNKKRSTNSLIPSLTVSTDNLLVDQNSTLPNETNALKSPLMRSKSKEKLGSSKGPYSNHSSKASLHPESAKDGRDSGGAGSPDCLSRRSSAASDGANTSVPGRSKTPIPEGFSSLEDMVKSSTYRKDGKIMYQCPHENCGKQFTRPFNLKSHYIAEHTDERPHACELCGQDFVRSHDLKRHIKTRHEMADRCKCHICHREFARKDALKRHLFPKDGPSACGLVVQRMEQEAKENEPILSDQKQQQQQQQQQDQQFVFVPNEM